MLAGFAAIIAGHAAWRALDTGPVHAPVVELALPAPDSAPGPAFEPVGVAAALPALTADGKLDLMPAGKGFALDLLPRTLGIDHARVAAGSVEPAAGRTVKAAAVAPPRPAIRKPGAAAPRIAIMIDDVGHDPAAMRALLDLGAPITLAFLPYPVHVPEMLDEARARGAEIFLHLPMEPEGNADAGPGALTADLGGEEIERRVEAALARVPGAVGVNNHMGSRLTTDEAAMTSVMRALRRHNVAFVDSRTSARSVAAEVASELFVPNATRNVFIDNVQDEDVIMGQLAKLERIARNGGTALGIGHPHPTTIGALRRWLPRAQAAGFEIVTAGAIIEARACGLEVEGAGSCMERLSQLRLAAASCETASNC